MDIVNLLREQAAEIAAEGHFGWGNTMLEAARVIEELQAAQQGVQADTRHALDGAVASCEWSFNEYFWDTSCGQGFHFEDGTPEENSFKHCPYCGRHLSVK